MSRGLVVEGYAEPYNAIRNVDPEVQEGFSSPVPIFIGYSLSSQVPNNIG